MVGPSGCGKSTLLRCVAGLEAVDEGAIRIGERDVTQAETGRAQRLDGLPELRALPAPDGAREHRLRSRRPRGAEAGCRRAGRGGVGARRRRGLPRAAAVRALRRRAPARRAREGARATARRIPPRRAPVEPRRGHAGADADRASPAPPRGRLDDGARHARPGRGADSGRQDRGARRGPRPAGRDAGRGLRASARPLRRRVPRQPVDELPRPARRRGRSARSRKERSSASGRSTSGSGRTVSVRGSSSSRWRAAMRTSISTAGSWRGFQPHPRPAEGARVGASFDRAAAHLFDEATGERREWQ